MRIAIRGILHGVKIWQDQIEIAEEQLDRMLPDLAQKHGQAMARGELGMIEIEFLDDPEGQHEFFRIGVDPSGMMAPMEVDLAQFAKRKVN